jgi:drug/metabolite transporter (DMT)-like permease
MSPMSLKLTESPRLASSPLLLIAPFFLWGTAMVAMKGSLDQTTPFFLAGVRLVPAGMLVLAWAALTGRAQPRGWAAWLWIGLFALVDGTLFQGFLAQGLQRTGAGLGSVMIDSQPLVVALLAWVLFGEQIGLWGALGLVIGVLGISLLGLPDAWLQAIGSSIFGAWGDGGAAVSAPAELAASLDSMSDSLLDGVIRLFGNGQWLMLLAALSMAVGTVLVRYVCRYVDPVVATGWHMIIGGLPLFGLSWGLETEQWAHLARSDYFALAYSTIFGSALAYGLFFFFASSGNLTSLSSLTFLTPVFALLFGNLFLGETLTLVQWGGVGLTLVSIYLINQRAVIAAKFAPPIAPDSPASEEKIALGVDSNP